MKPHFLLLSLISLMGLNSSMATTTVVEYPGKTPGAVTATQGNQQYTLENDILKISWTVKDGKLIPGALLNKEVNNSTTASSPELFRISSDNKEFNLPASKFTMVGNPTTISGNVNTKSPKAADSLPGSSFTATFKNEESGLIVTWTATLRTDSSYVKEEFNVKATKNIDLTSIELVSLSGDTYSIKGTVPGSPVVGENGTFAGIELPVTQATITGNTASIGFSCNLPMKAGQSNTFSTVKGVYPKGQLRRGFLTYLERERAKPYTQFLQYNCWYDFGLNLNEEKLIDVVNQYDKELIKKRNIHIDSFVVDDGWDDYNEALWQPTGKKFSNASFKKTADAIRAVGSNFGIWISPLGGYSGQNERIEWGRKMGLIPQDHKSLDLACEGYYNWFKNRCTDLMKKDGVNFFKWDKAGDGVSPHFMALLSIANDLRQINPNMFISTTVGTWPSPFWLNHVDCTWRDGSADVAWQGKGDDREQWITYRDANIFSIIVERGPLYPLSSMMHHGLVLGRDYQAVRVSKAGNDLKNDARNFFGNGANLQELYLTPSMMNDKAWDTVAEGVKWSNKFADVLADVHWIGGNPHKLEVYGYAAWSKKGATLSLRNPDDQAKEIELDATEVFEPTADAPKDFHLKASYTDQRIKDITLTQGKKVKITLQPFEVLVFDMRTDK